MVIIITLTTEEITIMVATTIDPTTNIIIITTKVKIKHTGDGSITSAREIEMMGGGITEDRGAGAPRMIEEAGNKGETRP